MMIRMDFALGPAWRIEASLCQRRQRRFLLSFKDLYWNRSCRSVNPLTGNIAAPDQSAPRGIISIDECLAFEEPLTHVAHRVFDNRFVFRVIGPRRIRQEASVRRILQKSP